MEIINHEYYVSLEVAELLKKAGFDWYNCSYRYNDALKLSRNIPGRTYGGDYHCIAPTLDVAQRWLREVKECAVIVMTHNVQAACVSAYVYCIYPTGAVRPCEHINGFAEDQCFDTYEEALEAGIKKALEIILEKGE